MAKIRSNSHIILYRRYARRLKFFLTLLCVLIITLFLPKQARFRFEYEKGKTWMQKDLFSPYNFAIQKTQAEVETDRQKAIASALPVYQLQPDVPQRSWESFLAEFETRFTSSGITEDQRNRYLSAAKETLDKVYLKGIYTPLTRPEGNPPAYLTVLDENLASRKLALDLLTIEQANRFVSEDLKSSGLSQPEWLSELLNQFLRPNLVLNEQLTEKVEQDALSAVSPTRGMVQKGELVVARGTIVTEEIFQKLESLRSAFEEDAKAIGDRRLIWLGQFLLVGMILTLLIIFLYLFRKDIYSDNRLLSLILLVITSMLVVLSWAINAKLPSLYYIPYAIVPIIIRILFDTRLALYIHILVVLIAGFFVPNSFEFAFLQITAGMVAIYSIKNLVKREQFLISAILILATYLVAFIGISLIRDGSFTAIEWLNFVPFIFSVLLSLLAYPLIYAFEKVFAITSDVTLMELTNTNSKLLRDLAFKAPGTFQHSLQVANLAEAAIYRIGGNALLVRAGALYHDIGKMDNAHFFIENQNKGAANPHDSLPYEESAQIIIQHVNKGVELARKNNIPEMLIDFIRTHHGNTRVDYFYQSFLKNFPEQFVDENIFRYPGPIPFSKETAVLMLADSVEAASRSLKDPDAQKISDLVDRIIDYKLEQDQLTNSNITLQELEIIKDIFKTLLMGIYHVRIDYQLKN